MISIGRKTFVESLEVFDSAMGRGPPFAPLEDICRKCLLIKNEMLIKKVRMNLLAKFIPDVGPFFPYLKKA